MIVDSSAIIAIILNEPEKPRLLEAMRTAKSRRMSAVTFVEAATVLDGRKKSMNVQLEPLLRLYDIEVSSFSPEQARIARDAFNRYGKGMGSGAKLNFGDCMAYGLAKATGLPLLYKGKDFGRTDIVPAIDWSEHG